MSNLSDDLAYGSGLYGPLEDICPNCEKKHAFDALGALAIVCACGWTAFPVIRENKVYCVWKAPELLRDKAEEQYNNLPFTN